VFYTYWLQLLLYGLKNLAQVVRSRGLIICTLWLLCCVPQAEVFEKEESVGEMTMMMHKQKEHRVKREQSFYYHN
jgi:hypothetical protein